MGKEWYWVGSRSTTNSKRVVAEKDTSTSATGTPSGCMSAVFQFFDFHHFQFPLHQHQPPSKPNSFFSEDRTILKGLEAPRNSLELEEPPLSSTSCFKEEEKLNISMGIRINTRKGHTKSKVGSASTDSSSEMSPSPGAKTPNLVARLMGLDLLPDSHSPSSPSFHETPNLLARSNLRRPARQTLQNKPITSHRNSIDYGHITGSRSLPETPRISSARRSDVDHHRLSLQINKENMGVGEEIDFYRFSYLRRKELKQEDEYRSPSHYARQIVKQVKESVSGKVGLDITNTLKSREQAREELVNQMKAKKISSRAALAIVDQSSPGKHSTPSCSPRLSRFLESKEKPTTPSSTLKDQNRIPHQPRRQSCSPSSQMSNNQLQPISSKPKLQPVQEQQHEQIPAKKCKKASSERFSPRLKKPPQTSDIIRNKQEEPFVRPSTANRANNPDKKCKKTPLSNELLNISVPALLPVKKDPSPPAIKIPQKQVLNAQRSNRSSQLSSNSSQTYEQEAPYELIARDTNDDRANGVTTTTTTVRGAAEYEYEYIAKILKRIGIEKHTQVSCIHWFSPSHPLNPSIFHHLENDINTHYRHHHSPLSHQCNRRLLFYLVDEILADILKPFIKTKPWIDVSHMHMQGSKLMEKLCMKIKSFPCADCRVLEHIDAIIEKDLPQMKAQNGIAFEEEEGVVMEIEKDILDTLIEETAVEFGMEKRKRCVSVNT